MIRQLYPLRNCNYKLTPENIANKVNHILNNQDLILEWKKNCNFAARELTWENEEVVLKEIYGKYV